MITRDDELDDSVDSRRHFLHLASTGLIGAAVLGEIPAHAQGRPRYTPTLEGKTAVVTGAARGIGRAIALDLARHGADIMGLDIAVGSVLDGTPASKQDLQETERMVRKLGRRFIPALVDVRDFQGQKESAARLEKEWGHLDIVVGVAGTQVYKPLLEMEDADWQDVLDMNLTGYAKTIRAFAPLLVKQKKGRIILIASSQARGGSKHATSYCTSKWGVLGLMKSAAVEFSEYRVTVNAVIPSEEGETLYAYPTEKQAVDASRVAWLQPEDIAPAVSFLASDDAYMVSGAVYDVTAGHGAYYQ